MILLLILLSTQLSLVALVFSYRMPEILIPFGVFGYIISSYATFVYGWVSYKNLVDKGMKG